MAALSPKDEGAIKRENAFVVPFFYLEKENMPETQTPIGFHEDGSFRFHLPFDLKKGEDGKTWIKGVASVEAADLAGETVILDGMDLSYLLKRGYFNDNHAKTTDAKVGVPTQASVTPEGLKVEGYLFDTPRAKGIIELADALKKSGSDRRLGFSIEGKTLNRDGKVVSRSWIKDIAITAEPVNPYTYLDVVKSISTVIDKVGVAEPDIVEDDEPCDLPYWGRVERIINRCLDRVFNRPAGPMQKMLEAGNANPVESGGGALRQESIDQEMTNLDLPQPDEDNGFKFDKAVELLINRGYSPDLAKRIAHMIFNPKTKLFLTNE